MGVNFRVGLTEPEDALAGCSAFLGRMDIPRAGNAIADSEQILLADPAFDEHQWRETLGQQNRAELALKGGVAKIAALRHPENPDKSMSPR